MSNKIHVPYYSISNSIYVTIRDDNGKVWNTSSKLFESWSDLSITNYVINAVYKKGSLYVANFPFDVATGYYTIMIFLQGGVEPVVSMDIWLGDICSCWDKATNSLVGVHIGVVNVDHDTTKTVIARDSDPTFPVERTSDMNEPIDRGH